MDLQPQPPPRPRPAPRSLEPATTPTSIRPSTGSPKHKPPLPSRARGHQRRRAQRSVTIRVVELALWTAASMWGGAGRGLVLGGRGLGCLGLATVCWPAACFCPPASVLWLLGLCLNKIDEHGWYSHSQLPYASAFPHRASTV
jgi:hypothetical protein